MVNRSGQIFSLDLMFAITIFLVVLVAIVIAVFTISDSYNPYSLYGDEIDTVYLSNNVNQALNMLTQSSGNPSNWFSTQCGNIQSIGLLNSSGYVSYQKLYNLTTLPTGCLSNLIKGGNAFNLTVTYLNHTPLFIDGKEITVGFIPIAGTNIVSNSRYMVTSSGLILRLNLEEWS